MITRLKVDGFKSLLNTELYFGPFTCIAGANAIGKSNLFDALVFLSLLADNTIIQAAKSIRSEDQNHSNIKDIFFKSGAQYYETITLEVDMLVPKIADDDLGQVAKPTITSLRYLLVLKLNNENSSGEPIEILKEELKPITLKDARSKIYFSQSKDWLNSVLFGRRSGGPFISTEGDKIKLHQDGNKGRSTEFISERMPRTLLSTVTAESPTAFLARQEMRNWMMLQFEPSSLRQPNSTFEVKNAEITASGLNLPATLYKLHNERTESDVYQSITNNLKDLVSDVDEIFIDKDEKRDLLTLQVKFKDGLILPAQSLSDGTLRFLGLAIIKEDNSSGVICLEEPENGINPNKVEKMVSLLKEITTDTEYPVDEDNPFRQVIINSHSPIVVSNVPEESLYLAKEKEQYLEQFGKKVKYTGFSALNKTWKTINKLIEITSLGEINNYLENNLNESDFGNNIISENQNTYLTKSSAKKVSRTVAQHIFQLKLELK